MILRMPVFTNLFLAAFGSLAKKILQTLLFDTGVTTLLKTMFRFGESSQIPSVKNVIPMQSAL
jgi:hypothetical protein